LDQLILMRCCWLPKINSSLWPIGVSGWYLIPTSGKTAAIADERRGDGFQPRSGFLPVGRAFSFAFCDESSNGLEDQLVRRGLASGLGWTSFNHLFDNPFDKVFF
jgi:hypothetical protein